MKRKILVLVYFLVIALLLPSVLSACSGGRIPTGTTEEITSTETEAKSTETPTTAPTETQPTEPTTAPATNETEPTETETAGKETEPKETEPEDDDPVNTEKPDDKDIPEAGSSLTVKEAIALAELLGNGVYSEGKYYVSGVVKMIVLPTTGKMIICDDEGNTISIGEAYNEDGTLSFGKMTDKPTTGDEITVYGAIGKSGSTTQMKSVWICAPEAPVETDPQETDPTETDPTETDPTETDPIETDPTETDPTETDTDTDTDPAETDTAETDTAQSETEGTETEPDFELTVEEAAKLGVSMGHNKYTTDKYYVTGTVKRTYANNVVLEDEKGNEITIFGAYNEDGTVKFKDMDVKPVAGDVVTVYGVVGQSNNSPRIKDGWIIEFGAPETEETTTEVITEATEPDTPSTPNYSALYPDGEMVKDAGIDWEIGFFANINHSIDRSAAIEITADALLEKLQDRDGENGLKAGEVFIVKEPLVLQSSKYYGNGAAIIAEGGIIIKDTVDVVVKDILIGGSITIENSAEIIFFKVFIDSDATAVTLKNSSDISFKTCRFRGNEAAIKGDADCVTVYSCYTYAHNGILLEGDDNIIQNCKMFASDTAVYVSGDNCVVRENRIEVYALGTGISVEKSENALVALNDIRGVQKSIVIDDCFNSAVILNRAILINGTNSTNLYVVDNNVGGYITLKDNNYLIAEGNAYPFDGLVHTMTASGNQNVNGNNITNVAYRPEYGANEEILPHTNKELFVAMPRKSAVADASFTSAKNLNAYVKESAQQSSIVVVPPGAYSAYGSFRIDENHEGTKIYAYGVYNEYSETDPHSYTTGQVVFAGAKNVSLYGLTLGYVLPSSGQVRIVEKYFTLANDDTKYYSEDELTDAQMKLKRTYKLTIIPDAGFLDGFTTTDSRIFHTWWPEFFLSDENGEQKMYCEENLKRNHSVEKNYDENGEYDGTMTLTIDLPETTVDDYREAKSAKGFFDRVTVGNVITCRFSFGGNGSYTVNGCDNIEFKDTVIYGYAGVLSIVAGNNAGMTFERHHNAVHSENVIDKETYEKYVALEEKWGVDFEIREQVLEDGTVIYRGPKSRTGSIDAFHIASNRQGVTVTASLLESMCDDGSNQKGSSSRLHNIVNNGDGTTTIYYKPLVASHQWNNSWGQPLGSLGTMKCTNFAAGNIIYIYTPEGRTVCETEVISSAVNEGKLTYDLTEGSNHHIIQCDYYSVTVRTDEIDWTAILDDNGNLIYDLSDNSHRLDNRLVVDNLSFNSCNYTMDNVMVYNGHSRGFLIKSRNVTIKNCTFRNVSNSGLRIMVEPEWGESSVAMNVVVQQCLFDNVGFHMQKYGDYTMANILIEGTSTVAGEHTLPIDNIQIIGNKFTNSMQRFGIYVNSAKNVVIKNNVFDPLEFELPNQPGLAVVLMTCMNVEISDNTYNYAHYDPNNIRSVIAGYNFLNITGTDVTNADGTPKLPDNTTAQ